MNKILKGTGLLLLGFLMLAWFVYSIMNPPTRPSETYSMDWVLIFLRLVGAIAAIVGGFIAFIRK
jgi:hypothetical protein